MRRLFKIVFGVIVALIVALVLAVILLVTLVNPNDFKDNISQMVYKQTGRNLTITGDISWRFFPWLGFKVSDVALGNPQGFAVKDFAKVGEADIDVRLLPLLEKRIEVGKLILQNANLQFVKEANGQNNWQDLMRPQKNSAKSVGEKALTVKQAQAPAAAKMAFLPFFVGNIDVKNAKVSYQDRVTGKSFSVHDLNFGADNISVSSPFDFNLSFAFENSAPVMSGKVNLQTEINIDVPNKLYALKNLQLTGSYNCANLNKPLPFKVSADVVTDLQKQFLTVSNAKVALANVSGEGFLKGEKIVDAPSFTGKFALNVNSVNKLLGFMKGGKALKQDIKSAALSFNFNASPKFAKLNDLKANLDDTTLSGNVDYSAFANKNISFNLHLNKLNAERYAMLAAAGAKVTAAPAKKAVTSHNASSTKMSLPLALEGDLQVDSLILNKLRAKDAVMHVVGSNNVIHFTKIAAKLYQGTLNSDLRVDLRRAVPHFTLNANLNNIALKPLLVDMAKLEKFTGTANLHFKMNGQGMDANSILRNLDGTGSFNVVNGVWHGVDIRYQINLANSIINKRPRPQKSNPPRTEFGKLAGTFIVDKGLLHNNDLLISSPYYRVDGKGMVNLITQTLDYGLQAAGMETVTDAAGNKVDQPTDFAVPIKITGPIADPKVYPDVGNLIKRAAGQAIQKEIGKALGEKLKIDPGAAGKIIKGLDLGKFLQ